MYFLHYSLLCIRFCFSLPQLCKRPLETHRLSASTGHATKLMMTASSQILWDFHAHVMRMNAETQLIVQDPKHLFVG